jgi:hypothetical protein
MNAKSIFFFDTMLTPKIITFVYWLLLAASVIGGITFMFGPFGGFFKGLGIMILGALGSRIYCELLIVLFKINENIQALVKKD